MARIYHRLLPDWVAITYKNDRIECGHGKIQCVLFYRIVKDCPARLPDANLPCNIA